MFVGIDPIILFVKDFDLQLAFYRDQVGLKYKEGSYGWAEFDVAGTVFALHGGYKGHVPKENNVARLKNDQSLGVSKRIFRFLHL